MLKLKTISHKNNCRGTTLVSVEEEFLVSNKSIVLLHWGTHPKVERVTSTNVEFWEELISTNKHYPSFLVPVYEVVEGPECLLGRLVIL